MVTTMYNKVYYWMIINFEQYNFDYKLLLLILNVSKSYKQRNIGIQSSDTIQCKVHENLQYSMLYFQQKGISAKFVTFG